MKEKQNKMRNKKVEYDGIKFDSQMECNYYEYLLSKSKINIVELQPKFVLVPKFKHSDGNIRELAYIADFTISRENGKVIEVIDIKGQATEVAKIKRKLFQYFYPDIPLLWITESKKHGKDGWISYDDLKKIRAVNKKARLKNDTH